jgi:ribosome biogenesis GTPase A
MIKNTFKANRPKVIGDTNITPYWKVIENIIKDSDIILEILDARMPNISRNIELEELIEKKEKELIFILNKSDLISPKELRKKFQKLNKIKPTFIISSKQKIGTKRLREYLFKIGKKQDWFKIGIVGYPNTGKSSVINSLVKKNKAVVTSRAGTTHGAQWISLKDNILIIDSPGIIPLKKDDEIRLALIGSKNIEKIKNLELVAREIIKLFENKTKLYSFYKLSSKPKNPEELIEEIGKKRGFIRKGGQIDISRVAIQIIRDWQNGKLRQ